MREGKTQKNPHARKQLTLALILRAFEDHYIEDSFAPGYLLTPRTSVNNIGAKALHDQINKNGAAIKVETKNNPELGNYLDLIKAIYGAPEDGVCRIKHPEEDAQLNFYGDGRLKRKKAKRT
jgi:hypothetical protein